MRDMYGNTLLSDGTATAGVQQRDVTYHNLPSANYADRKDDEEQRESKRAVQ